MQDKKIRRCFYIILHCPDDDKNALTTNMGIYKKKTFFSEYAPNPFEANKNSEMYQTIFKDNIEEKTNNLITVEKTNILMQNELIYEKELKEKYGVRIDI